MTLPLGSRWAGADLGPCPHESSLGVWLRFAWRNALPWIALRDCMGLSATQRPTLYDGDRLSQSALPLALEWSLPTSAEIAHIGPLRALQAFWFGPRLRICPVCMEAGYHSVWHQFLPLSQCPVHACPLTSTCQSCGAALPPYALPAAFGHRAYMCRHCREPMAGGAPMLDLHLDLRAQSPGLDRAFEPLACWSRGRPLASRQYNTATLREVKRALQLEGRQPGILSLLKVRMHELPAECQAYPYGELHMASWEIPRAKVVDRLLPNAGTIRAARSMLPKLLVDPAAQRTALPWGEPSALLCAEAEPYRLDRRRLSDLPAQLARRERVDGEPAYGGQSEEWRSMPATSLAGRDDAVLRERVILGAFAHVALGSALHLPCQLEDLIIGGQTVLAVRATSRAHHLTGSLIFPRRRSLTAASCMSSGREP